MAFVPTARCSYCMPVYQPSSLLLLCGNKIIDCIESVEDIDSLPLPKTVKRQLEELVPDVSSESDCMGCGSSSEDSDDGGCSGVGGGYFACDLCYADKSSECDCSVCPCCHRKTPDHKVTCENGYCNRCDCKCCKFCKWCKRKFCTVSYTCASDYCVLCHYCLPHPCRYPRAWL